MKNENKIRLISILACLILLMIIFSSCNQTKQIQRQVKKHGAKEVLAVIIQDYPELFVGNNTDTIYVNKNVYIPEIVVDTIYSAINCPELVYKDTNIMFTVKDNKIKYIIKERKVTVHDTIQVKSPVPCPDMKLLPKPKESEIKTIYKWWSWFTWIIIFILIVLKLLKKQLHL